MNATRLVSGVLILCGSIACAGPGNGASAPQGEGPPLERMLIAPQVGKMGAPVEVRYSLPPQLAKDQPATLDLAFVPQAEGTNLRVEFPANEAASLGKGAEGMRVGKAQAASVHRLELGITPRQAATGEVRVLVSIDVGNARYAGLYSVPLGSRLSR